jgi:predicted transcriptional regulator of viral defense system
MPAPHHAAPMSLRTRQLLEAVDWVASDQDGLITAAQVDEIGIPRSTLSRRIRTGGQWRRVLPGVYLVSEGPMSIHQRERAALLFAGADGVLSGTSGLRRRGVEFLPVDPAESDVLVAIPSSQHRKSAGFVIVERTQRPPQATSVGGAPVASAARCTVDAARRLTDRRATRAMTFEVIQRGLASIAEIDHERRHAQRRGTALLTDTLAEARAGVRSAPEAELRQFALASSLPLMWWNPTLWTPDGEFVAMPDALVVESLTVVEVQSRKYHDATDEQFESTLQRTSRLERHGLVVVQVVPGAMRRNPNETLRQIADGYTQSLTRSRPLLIARDSRGVMPGDSTRR